MKRSASFTELIALLDSGNVTRISEPHSFGVNGQHRVYVVDGAGELLEFRYTKPYRTPSGRGRDAAVRKRADWTLRIPLESPDRFAGLLT